MSSNNKLVCIELPPSCCVHKVGKPNTEHPRLDSFALVRSIVCKADTALIRLAWRCAFKGSVPIALRWIERSLSRSQTLINNGVTRSSSIAQRGELMTAQR